MVVARLLVTSLVAALGLVLTSYTPAHACSCVMGNDAKYLAWSDVAFHGTLNDVDGGEPTTYAFTVDRVFEGEAAETTDVLSSGSGASCGLEGMEVGEEYVVFATLDGGSLWASLCGGTRTMDASGVAHLEDRLGLARPPTPGVMEADAADGGDLTPWLVAAPALVLVVGVGLLVWRRRRA